MESDVAKRWEKRLQRELGDPYLRVRWNHEIERYEVGQKSAIVSDLVYWFYVLTDGQSGFRNPDEWSEAFIRKIRSLTIHGMKWTPEEVARVHRECLEKNRQKAREELQYRLKHVAKDVKRAAERDGLV